MAYSRNILASARPLSGRPVRSALLSLAFLAALPLFSPAGAEGATVKTISWVVPSTYEDQTAIPQEARQTIETRLYYSLDNLSWTRFATVPGGGVSWNGTLPVPDGVTGYYGATATVPASGIESRMSEVVTYPPAPAAAERFVEIDVVPANFQDTYVAAGDAANHSADPLIRTQARPGGVVSGRGFLRFDLSSLPVGARVSNAALRLYYLGEEAGGGDDLMVVKAARVAGATLDPAKANWYSPDNVAPWTGGPDGGAGNLAAAEATAVVGKGHGWVVWNVTNMVRDWLDTPGKNSGLALEPAAAGTGGGNRLFASREHPDPRLRPELLVTFLQPSGGPTQPGNQAGAPPAPAFPTDTFTGSFAPAQDTYVKLGNSSNSNYSSEALIRTHTWPANNVANRGFIRWDLSAIPDNVTVTSATLWLYYADEEGSGGDDAYTVSVSKVTGVLPDLGKATWNRYDGASPWPGGRGGGAGAMEPATSSVTIGKARRWVAWDVTDMVQGWVTRPGTNLGMAIDADASAGADSNRYFASGEHPDPSLRPRLLVTFTRNPQESPARTP